MSSPWTFKMCPQTGSAYFVNKQTGESVWECPPELWEEFQANRAKKIGSIANKTQTPIFLNEKWARFTNYDGAYYYGNKETKEVQWEIPQECQHVVNQLILLEEDKSTKPLFIGHSWARFYSDGIPYYVNKTSGVKQWDFPIECDQKYNSKVIAQESNYERNDVESKQNVIQQIQNDRIEKEVYEKEVYEKEVYEKEVYETSIKNTEVKEEKVELIGSESPSTSIRMQAQYSYQVPETKKKPQRPPTKTKKANPVRPGPKRPPIRPKVINKGSNRPTLSKNIKKPSGPIPRPGKKGNTFALPRQLRDDISKFQRDGFASQHFREVKKRKGFVRRKVPVQTMLSWQKTPLSKPLLIKSGRLKKDSLSIFKNILQFMGDSQAKKTQDALSKLIVQKGVNKPELRDEIFCQLCKQTTNNPSPVSCANGWKLLTICCASFQTTAGFQDFVLHHFTKSGQSGTGVVKKLAPYCYWRLSRTILDKTGTFPPPALRTIDKMVSNGIKPYQVFFGGNLHYIMDLHKNDEKVPSILPKLFEMVKDYGGFQSQGIFRKSASQFDVDALKKRIETKGDYSIAKEDPHIPASLIKIWLRELDVPLIPPALYETCLKKYSPEECMEIMDVLPQNNYDCFAYLLTQLSQVLEYASVTNMNAENLAIVFSPNLLKAPNDADPSQLMRRQEKEQLFMINLITQWAYHSQDVGIITKSTIDCSVSEIGNWCSNHKHSEVLLDAFAGMSGEELHNSEQDDIIYALENLERAEALAIYQELRNPINIQM